MTDLTGWQQRAVQNSAAVRRTQERTVEIGQRLIDEARALYYRTGKPFTISQLIQQADIAGQTFYRYFPSKEDLLLALFEDTVRQRAEPVREKAEAEPDPVARIKLLINELIGAVQSDPYASTVIREHMRLAEHHPDVIRRIAEWSRDLLRRSIVEGIESGVLTSKDPESDARVIADGIRITVHHIVLGVTREPVDEVTAHYVDFCMAALQYNAE